jgi:hypothetical protein
MARFTAPVDVSILAITSGVDVGSCGAARRVDN